MRRDDKPDPAAAKILQETLGGDQYHLGEYTAYIDIAPYYREGFVTAAFHLAWHETLDMHELVAFQTIGLIKLKRAGDLLGMAKTLVRNYAIAITETATPKLREVLQKQINGPSVCMPMCIILCFNEVATLPIIWINYWKMMYKMPIALYQCKRFRILLA